MKKSVLFFLFLCKLDVYSQPTDSSKTFNAEKTLKEVNLISRKPFIERQADKVVLNIQQDVLAQSSNLFEIIQRAPSVFVSQDDLISMSGKSGVNILIDGRPVQLSGKDLGNYLRSILGTEIEKIEVIASPSARYDAQGNAGIINIRLKKNNVRGTNGNLGLAFTQSNHPNINTNATLNRRRDKWNWFSSVSARKSRQNTDGAIHRNVNSNGTTKLFENKTVDEDASSNATFKAGADYNVNKKTTLGFIIKGNEYRSKMYTPGMTLIKTNNITDSSLRTVNDNHQRNGRYNYNINYAYRDTSGLEWNTDADYTYFSNRNYGPVTTDLLNKQGIKYGYTENDQNLHTTILVYGIKTDFIRAIKKANSKIETGLKWNTTKTNNDLRAFIWSANSLKNDTGRTNQFDYTETQYAAYFSYTQTIKKLEFQLGFRGEQSIVKGRSTDLRKTVLNYPDTSYFNLFPTAFARYTINSKHSIGLSANRRINRPTYQDLNPFEYIFDNYTRERGNPYLQPELSTTVELNYSFNSALDISIGYSHTNNAFGSISTQHGEITQETDYNIGKQKRAFMNVSLTLPVTKWWNSYTNLSPFYKKFDGITPQGILDDHTLGMSWYASNNFSLPKKWKAQLSTWGSAGTLDGIYKNSWLGSIDAACSKTILKEKLTLRLSVTDIFNTQRWKQVVNFGPVDFTYYRKWESRTIRLQATWKFGKTNYKARERELGAEKENERIK